MEEDALEKEVSLIRSNDFAINPIILNRWSPRSFLAKPVAEVDLLALLEAARWAPSCFNEQPARFIVARKPEDLEKMRGCLNPGNRVWAGQAPVLIAVLSHPFFRETGKPNRWAAYDSGTAWGYLALEAFRRGLFAHAMGGFSVEKARAEFGVPAEWGIQAILAVGYRGPREQLPPELQARETPSNRNPLNEIWAEGKFGF